MRAHDRAVDALRPLKIQTDYLDFAESSTFIEAGKTKVLVAASVEEKVPPFLKNSGQGWVTGEYSMLPRSTERRNVREGVQGRPSGRTQEIQRLIGRSLRAVTDLRALGERTIILDCDVIQADGGTRSASITAAGVALALCLKRLLDAGLIDRMPLSHLVGAVSVGIVNGEYLLDLDYAEDSTAEVDMNVVQSDKGQLVEVQVSAEKNPFSRKALNAMMQLADKGINEIIQIQREILIKKSRLFMAYS
jgi:ribonuclease PH